MSGSRPDDSRQQLVRQLHRARGEMRHHAERLRELLAGEPDGAELLDVISATEVTADRAQEAAKRLGRGC